MSATPSVSSTYGVHSEVGTLRKVLVCRPGLAHRRLTPANSDDLLFDDVLWVENAERDHADFVRKMTDRGVEVVELHDLVTATMRVPGARDWLLDRLIVPNEVGIGLVDPTRGFSRFAQASAAHGVPHRRPGHQRPARRAPLAVRGTGPGVHRRA